MFMLAANRQKPKTDILDDFGGGHGTVNIEAAPPVSGNHPFEEDLVRVAEAAVEQNITQLAIVIANFEQGFHRAAFGPAPDPLGRSPTTAEQPDGTHHDRLACSCFTGHHQQGIAVGTVEFQVQGVDQGQIFYFEFE